MDTFNRLLYTVFLSLLLSTCSVEAKSHKSKSHKNHYVPSPRVVYTHPPNAIVVSAPHVIIGAGSLPAPPRPTPNIGGTTQAVPAANKMPNPLPLPVVPAVPAVPAVAAMSGLSPVIIANYPLPGSPELTGWNQNNKYYPSGYNKGGKKGGFKYGSGARPSPSTGSSLGNSRPIFPPNTIFVSAPHVQVAQPSSPTPASNPGGALGQMPNPIPNPVPAIPVVRPPPGSTGYTIPGSGYVGPATKPGDMAVNPNEIPTCPPFKIQGLVSNGKGGRGLQVAMGDQIYYNDRFCFRVVKNGQSTTAVGGNTCDFIWGNTITGSWFTFYFVDNSSAWTGLGREGVTFKTAPGLNVNGLQGGDKVVVTKLTSKGEFFIDSYTIGRNRGRNLRNLQLGDDRHSSKNRKEASKNGYSCH